MLLHKYIWVGIGGFIGAMFRYLVKGMHIGQIHSMIPFSTLIANTMGCFVLGLVLAYALESSMTSHVQLGITTGFLGAFTTFSTLCKETVQLFYQQLWSTAAAYLIVTVVLGFVAVYSGTVLMRVALKGMNGDLINAAPTERIVDESEDE